MIARRVVVRGHVQGVYFRETARRLAERSGVGGWIANHSDGSVEAVFEGTEPAVDRLVEWCRAGPRGASVERVEVAAAEPRGAAAFVVR